MPIGSLDFTKILIANRGEIACRIMATAKAMGFETVALYSDADADAPHVAMADQAVRIGPAPAAESYLDIDALIDAAKLTEADAIHPGYGFLSENPLFAGACASAGIRFVGPGPSAIRAMADKALAKQIMRQARVPLIPGYDGDDQSDARLFKEALELGFPIMIKATAGGGGRGMRYVARPEAFQSALDIARSEAERAFGSGKVLLEKALLHTRHIEIQVIADTDGHVIHLGERDCSLQRRHQKVVEEAPSPGVGLELREALGAAAVAAARAVDYVGAGTVEFLVDRDDNYYFLEMNTRLQVEHPVTEMITGVDIVALQLQVAAGRHLDIEQHQVVLHGHAIEVRLYAEDPDNGFLPQAGRLAAWLPPAGEGIRVDHGLASRLEITPHYDPMIAKIIAHGATREIASRRLLRALDHTVALGVKTNRALLAAAITHPAFVQAEATTSLIDEEVKRGGVALAGPKPDRRAIALAAVLWYWHGAEARDTRTLNPLAASWTSATPCSAPLHLQFNGETHVVAVTLEADRYTVDLAGDVVDVVIRSVDEPAIRFRAGGIEETAYAAFAGGELYLSLGLVDATFREVSLTAAEARAAESSDILRAPMNGRIVAVRANAGDRVERGDVLVVLEAMKMQHEIAAGRDAIIAEVAVREGQQVGPRDLLVSLVAEERLIAADA